MKKGTMIFASVWMLFLAVNSSQTQAQSPIADATDNQSTKVSLRLKSLFHLNVLPQQVREQLRYGSWNVSYITASSAGTTSKSAGARVIGSPVIGGQAALAPLGTQNFIVKFGTAGSPTDNSQLFDDGTSVSINGTATDLFTVMNNRINSTAIHGQSQGQDGIGVLGENLMGIGVFGLSQTGFGMCGESSTNSAVVGKSKTGDGVVGISTISGRGVFGRSEDGVGVVGQSTNDAGVLGRSLTNGTGVVGASEGGIGVLGVGGNTRMGVMGLGIGPSGTGVFGSWSSFLGGSGNAGYFQGNVTVTGFLAKGGGSFKIDHPLDPANKYLSHSFVESPDMMNIYNGNVLLDANGEAVVELPEWFGVLNKDFRYQLTAIGVPGPNLYIAEKVSHNRFKIAGGQPEMEVSWQVTGTRQDRWANANRVQVEEDKPEHERGYYLHPELYGESEERSIEWARHPELMQRINQMKQTYPNNNAR